MSTQKTSIIKDASIKKLHIVRAFDAPLEQVWRAWTESDILDQWWAPAPYRAETKSMDFREGGHWLYAMVSPEGDKSWCRVDFRSIEPQKSFYAENGFADEAGNRTYDLPAMDWRNEFSATATGTSVSIEIEFASEADLEQIIGLGFESGFTSGLSNLDSYLSTHF